jgi:glucosylceramidase
MKKISVYLTQLGSQNRLTLQQHTGFVPKTGNPEMNLICIYEDVEYQRILGFGGALTESAGYCYSKLSANNKERLIEAYFDKKNGIGYSFCRTHLNSSDFSLGNYSCCENESKGLEGFNIQRDKQYIIPLIKAAQQKVDIKLLISPWSPPAWMKTNEMMNRGGKLKKDYYDAWALYYVKFIKSYQQMGIDTFAITVQNEPNAVQTWDSCTYTGEEERDFVKNHLGPVLEKEGLSDVNIFIWDHNKERVYERSKIIYDDAEKEGFISCFPKQL